jgi:GNAT superfamily N-acetyltransferase
MQLRTATLADLATVVRHRRNMFYEMGHTDPVKLDRLDESSAAYFESAIQNGSYYGVLLEEGPQVVAGAGVILVDWPGGLPNFLPKRAWIINMYVEQDCRRRGYARLLMQALIEWCRRQGFDAVALHASQFGRDLYLKLGFAPTSEMRLTL